MGKLIDLTNQKFERLTVVRYLGDGYWECSCDCDGKLIRTKGSSLRTGHTKSCGCIHREAAGLQGARNKKHGDVNTRLYKIWINMKARCSNPNREDYKRYGGNGIEVCSEWENDFESFKEWSIANGYQENLTIDRKDNGRGYTPDNCRWVTNKTQQRNTKRNHFISYKGQTKCISEWAEELGIKADIIYSRLGYGWSEERALTEPVRKRGRK